jgi:protein scribble
MGDRIVKVNGEDVSKSSHQEAVLKLLKPGDEIVLTIQHDPLPEGYQVGILLPYAPQLCCAWWLQQL